MKFNKRVFILIFSFFLFRSLLSFASQGVNSKDALEDPNIARLQQGRKELTSLEKEEMEKYGYTGLEIMTYLYDNKHPGQKDNDEFHRCVNWTGESLKVQRFLIRRKYYYKGMKEYLNSKRPGDAKYKLIVFVMDPPASRGFGAVSTYFFESEKKPKDKEQRSWIPNLRRIRRDVAPNKQEEYANMVVTYDDDEVREPWEEKHRILGEDTIRGHECFVIESKHHLIPDYYLSKRVTWVDKKIFIDHHEEQFDRKGKLYKIFDLDWYQVKPSGQWVPRETNVVKLPGKERTIHQTPAWLVDQGISEGDVSLRVLENERPWREVDSGLKPINGLSDLSPEPQIRWEFWEKIGIKPEVKD